MAARMRISTALFVAGLLFASEALAQNMKLVGPGVGWTDVWSPRVFWTTNNGSDWKDITPPYPKNDAISAVFFLDRSHGWVVLANGEPDVLGGMSLDLAVTHDSGVSWSVAPISLPDWLSHSLIGVGADIAFADPKDGWLVLDSGINQASRGHGSLLTTSDGGKSWHSPRPPNHSSKEDIGLSSVGPIVLVTPKFGWMVVGGPANDALHVTRDGAKTWQQIELKSPVRTDQMRKYDQNLGEIDPRDYAAYSLPTFEDSKHGYVSVTYPEIVVLFATDDGGITWKADRMLRGMPEHSMGTTVVTTVVDSIWITARAPYLGQEGFGAPNLRKLDHGADVRDSTMPNPEAAGIFQMTFVTPNEGWVWTPSNLMATKDGGASWTDIAPPRR